LGCFDVAENYLNSLFTHSSLALYLRSPPTYSIPPILHRDLKPANLLVDFKDTLKISDFGLAKLRPYESLHKINGNTPDTNDTFIMTGETGSYRFMAPEVFRHERYDETVDVYSFAMILYNLIDGSPPWPNANGVKAVTAAAEGQRPNIPRHWDEKLSNLITRCWDESPKKRLPFGDILEMLQE
jgi:serine/threonine protein kinase